MRMKFIYKWRIPGAYTQLVKNIFRRPGPEAGERGG
jgi:hypothetical protein